VIAFPGLIGLAQKVENPTHGSGWIVQIFSNFEGSSVSVQSHLREWVDGSDRLYFDLGMQMLAQDNFVAPIRNDLNNPPTFR
jgi:hypothetical protein